MNIAIVGSKGAGKGTQISLLKQAFGVVAFSTGDALRDGIKQRTPLGIQAKRYVQRGELVPDEIVNGLVEEWIWRTTPSQEIVFDGFPRTVFQADFLESALRDMGRRFCALVYLDLPDDAVVQRLSGRRVCSVCDEEYHLVSARFTICRKEKCDGEWLRQAEEDRPETIAALLSAFRLGVDPLLRHYERSGRLIRINGHQAAGLVHEAILAAVTPLR